MKFLTSPSFLNWFVTVMRFRKSPLIYALNLWSFEAFDFELFAEGKCGATTNNSRW